jgi:ribosome maturation factor RimP
VTVEDCAAVSREVRRYLESQESAVDDWVLEVSSPGVERPLTRPRDFVRFAGENVRIRGFKPLVEGSRQIEGRIVGMEGEAGREVVVLDVKGEPVRAPFADIAKATLVYEFAG